MQKLYLFIVIILFFGIESFSQSKKIQVTLDFRQFYNPQQGNYMEVMMQFGGYSMEYKTSEDKSQQGKLEVTQVFRKGDSVVEFKKYEILTPIIKDSIYEDFYDIQRFQLSPGNYTYDIRIVDVYAKKKKNKEVSYSQPITIEDYRNKMMVSRPEYIEVMKPTDKTNMFSKSGIDIVPYISNYFPSEINNIAYYNEIYLPLDTSGFVLKEYITNENGDIVNNLFKIKRIKGADVIPVINKFDISKLGSGNYFLVLQIVDKENKEITKRKEFFQRLNPYQDFDPSTLDNIEVAGNFKNLSQDSIFYYIESHIPITQKAEQKNILSLIKRKDTTSAKKYLYSFWKKTSPNDPWFGYLKYMEQVYKVEQMYSTNIRPGFQTDRGNVYLKYGAPNSVLERPSEPNSYPYEIWHYYQIENQSNRKFVFYNPSLINNYYDLLHSDMIGELQNNNWQHDLRNRTTTPDERLNNRTIDSYGGNAEDWFNNDY